jgi:sulfite exporter TauE/SafE
MKNSFDEQIKQEDLVEKESTATPSSNPFAGAASISLSLPETVEIKLVDASALADYEVWFFLTSMLSSTVVGFIVAGVQSQGQPIQRTLFAISIVTGLIMLVCGIMAFCKRRKLRTKTKKIKFRVGDQVAE